MLADGQSCVKWASCRFANLSRCGGLIGRELIDTVGLNDLVRINISFDKASLFT